MRSVTELVNNAVIRATSPDGRIRAKYTSARSMAIKISDGCYEQYDEKSLAAQLRALLRELFESRHRALNAVQREVLAGIPAYRQLEPDPAERRFVAELEELVCVGKSRGELIKVGCRGQASEVRVAIEDGTLARMSGEQFLGEFKKALAAMMADYRAKVSDLVDERQRAEVRNPASVVDSRTVPNRGKETR